MDNEQACIDRAGTIVREIRQYMERENSKPLEDSRSRSKTEWEDEEKRRRYALRHFDVGQFAVSRSGPHLTIFIPYSPEGRSRPFQLTLTATATVQERLTNCFPSCTAVALYRGKVYFNELSRYCFESLCMVVGG